MTIENMENKNINSTIKTISRGICAVDEVKVAGVREGKYGVSIIFSPNSDVAAVFTSNKVIAAPVKYTKKIIEDGKLSVIVANSGNANCFTGYQGVLDCENSAELSSKLLDVTKNDIAIASTGVIGRKMPMDIISKLINKGVKNLENSKQASMNCAKAIMTTDTVYKESAVEVTLENDNVVKIGAICKGTGMIAPNMGTMLCFIATDAKADKNVLKQALKLSVEDSFNMVVVDGDESTNDTVLLFANGKSVNKVDNSYGVIDKNFQEGLNVLCKELAKQMAKDGEGATKFLEVEVNGAKNKNDAQIASKSVVKSSLVKTAVFGEDPNWGRIVAAIGYSNAEMDPDNITVAISANNEFVDLVKDGEILAFEGTSNLRDAENIMKNKEIKISIDLKQGNYSATAYGCDLTYDYVKINAEYTT